MNDFWAAVIGGILSPVAIIALLAALRDRLFDHFFAARLERIKADINQALETHKATLQRETRQLESTVKQTEAAYAAVIEMGSTMDLDLRQRRITAYEDLWKKTTIIPRWPRANDVTYSRLKQFSAELRSWYFEKGGMYLSETSTKAYSELQEKIWDILSSVDENKLDQVIQGSEARDLSGHYDSIRLKCSKLRTSLTNDILSRRAAPASHEGDDSK